MNILFVSLPIPWPLDNGGRLRRFHLVRELARRHSVTLATLLPREKGETSDPSPLHEVCKRVIELGDRVREGFASTSGRWRRRAALLSQTICSLRPRPVQVWSSPHVIEVLRSLYQADKFDTVWIDRAYLGVAAEKAGIPRFVVDVDDLDTTWLSRSIRKQSWGLQKALDLANLPKTYIFEKGLTRRFWRCVVCKEEDRTFLGSRADSVFVVPNGVTAFPCSPPTTIESQELLFVGSMDSDPNVDAVRWFCEAVLPETKRDSPQVRLSIVGRNPTSDVQSLQQAERVVVTGAVPDTATAYERAAIVIAPLRLGSGTKLKVLEALGRGKAVVCTSIAAEGLDIRPGVDFLLADTPKDFAAACTRLLRDPAECLRLGQSGRQRAYERYHWESIGKIAEQALTPTVL